MREGRALLIDDATFIPPKVLAMLYPAMFLREFTKTEGSSVGTDVRLGVDKARLAWVRSYSGAVCELT
jgi:hypothetical protein